MSVQQSKINLDEILNNLIEDENKRLKKIWDTHYKLNDIAKKLNISSRGLRDYLTNHQLEYIVEKSPENKITAYISKDNVKSLLMLRGIIK